MTGERPVLCGGAIVLVVLLAGLAGLARGATTYWNTTWGYWSTGADWTAGEPVSTTNAYVGVSLGAPVGTVYINQTSEVCNDLFVGCEAGKVGTVSMWGGTLSSYGEIVGFLGTGRVEHSGGYNSVVAGVLLGCFPGASGTYTLSGTGRLSADSLYVGGGPSAGGGTGVFTVASAGGATFASRMKVWGTSTINLNGGGTVYADVVERTAGSRFNTEGGSYLVVNNLVGFGTSPVFNGRLAFGTTAGTTAAAYSIGPGASLTAAEGLYVGYDKAATFTHSGGTNTGGSYLCLGVHSGGIGTYSLSGGALSTTYAQDVGLFGTGTFNHSGGTNTLGAELDLGVGHGSSGTYILSGTGALSSDSAEYVGSQGNGTFNHSGGTNTLVGHLYLGRWPGGSGTYSLSGSGALSSGPTQYVGYLGAGTFTQTGGVNTITRGDLNLGGASGEGLYTISGGVLRVVRSGDAGGRIVVGAESAATISTFAFSGGSVEAERLYLGPFALAGEPVQLAGTGRLVLSGTTLRLTGSVSLANPSVAILGGSIEGNGRLDVPGGPITAVDGGRIAASGGTLTVNGMLVGAARLEAAAGATLRARGYASGGSDIAGTLTTCGGDLTLEGTNVVNTGTLSNAGATNLYILASSLLHAGNVQANVGGGVYFDHAITVASGKRIDLLGGAVISPRITVAAGGTIAGMGAVSAALDNQGAGLVDFYGNSQVFGTVLNSTGGQLRIRNGDLLITGPTTNYGTIKALNGNVYFEGGLTSSGQVNIDPATAVSVGPMRIEAGGYVIADAGSRLKLLGDFLNTSTQNTLWQTSQAELVFQPGASNQHTLGVPGTDLGKVEAGWTSNFAWGTLRIEPAQRVTLQDGNATSGGALYVDNLLLGGVGAYVATNSLNLYYRNGGMPKQFFYGDANLDGTVDVQDLALLAFNYNGAEKSWNLGDFTGDGLVNVQDLAVLAFNYNRSTPPPLAAVPEPATLFLLTMGLAALGKRRR